MLVPVRELINELFVINWNLLFLYVNSMQTLWLFFDYYIRRIFFASLICFRVVPGGANMVIKPALVIPILIVEYLNLLWLKTLLNIASSHLFNNFRHTYITLVMFEKIRLYNIRYRTIKLFQNQEQQTL